MVADQHKAPDTPSPEDARVAYQAAVAMACAEAGTVWSKFTAFIYANTIILLTMGLALGSNADKFRVLATILGVLGVALCAGWHQLNRLSFAWFAYWVKSARSLERHLGANLTYENGATLSQGNTIRMAYLGESENFTLPKGPKIRTISALVILAFVVAYVVIVVSLWCAP